MVQSNQKLPVELIKEQMSVRDIVRPWFEVKGWAQSQNVGHAKDSLNIRPPKHQFAYAFGTCVAAIAVWRHHDRAVSGIAPLGNGYAIPADVLDQAAVPDRVKPVHSDFAAPRFDIAPERIRQLVA